ncbi:hypothetical protein J6590_025079 [Homalodisca vitripennis]|nr:hypothetical protein J6590_025079 [Homalodisca vitripennis]
MLSLPAVDNTASSPDMKASHPPAWLRPNLLSGHTPYLAALEGNWPGDVLAVDVDVKFSGPGEIINSYGPVALQFWQLQAKPPKLSDESVDQARNSFMTKRLV